MSFARGLSPARKPIVLIKRKHHTDYIWELECIRYLKILVIDLAKKLQTSTEHQTPERHGRGDIAEPQSKS